MNKNDKYRRSIRLRQYDYTQVGAYFVTICTYERAYVFGDVVDGVMQLSAYGQIVQTCWQNIALHISSVTLDACVIMPNHIHGMLVLAEGPVRAAGDMRPGNMTPVEAQHAAPFHPPNIRPDTRCNGHINQSIRSIG